MEIFQGDGVSCSSALYILYLCFILKLTHPQSSFSYNQIFSVPFKHLLHVPPTCSLLPAPFPISCREACQTYYLTSALNSLRGQDNQHKKNYFLIFQFLRICFLPLHQQTNAQHRADTSTSILFPLPVLAQQDGLHLLISLCISILLRRTDVPHLCVPPTKTTPLCTSPYPHFHALLPAVFLTIFAPLS